MTTMLNGVREILAKKPGAVLGFPFGEGTEVYKVGGKMFALVTLRRDPVWLQLKLRPADGLEMRAMYPETVLPGYHLNKEHWNTVILAGTPPIEEVDAMIADSYELVVTSLPKRLRQKL